MRLYNFFITRNKYNCFHRNSFNKNFKFDSTIYKCIIGFKIEMNRFLSNIQVYYEIPRDLAVQKAIHLLLEFFM